MNAQMTIPEGYKLNAIGHLVPIESIKEIDLTRDEFVRSVVKQAKEMAKSLEKFKGKLSDDMQAFLDLSIEKYGVTQGGAKGNLDLLSFDGRFKVSRAVAKRFDFDERLQAAKYLVDECLREWTKESGSEIRTLIEDAFQVDQKGKSTPSES